MSKSQLHPVRNRLRLVASFEADLIVMSAYTQLQRGNDAAFMFEQEANFLWLTGINAPDWWVVIDSQSQKTWLVSPVISEVSEIFNGSLSTEKALAISGADGVLSEDEAIAILRDLSKKYTTVYSVGLPRDSKYYEFSVNPAPQKLWKKLQTLFKEVKDCRTDVAKLRAIKQSDEITALRQAIELTTAAFDAVKSKLVGFAYEYEIEAEFTYRFRKNGATGHAYDPIVAGGKNACILHYNSNNEALPENGLVLMDVGASVNGYAADITRTYVIGTPTARQLAIYKAVETAHHKIIGLIKPGVLLKEYLEAVDEVMKDALQEVGLLKNRDDHATYRKYFPHAISHGLGIDVHESLGGYKEFQPGMVLTVEPGIYIPEEGIGVRIEDDILVTKDGNENLSAALSTSL